MSSIFAELKRRNVFRVTGVYAVVGWVLAQIATTMEEAMGLPAWFDGLIVALLLLGLPVAIVLAWAFELTPDGIRRDTDAAEGESSSAGDNRKLDYVIVAGLALVVAMIVWQQTSTPPAVAEQAEVGESPEIVEVVAEAASIAVLPFADLSPAGDQAYFSDGIAEEILNVLVGIEGLDVKSRTSSFQFKGRDLGIPEIAQQLTVRHVVEGSVRKSGETIRVTAQLIDASNDKHLWSETYDRPLTAENIFDIQDDIADSIVGALSNALGLSGLEEVDVETSTRNLTAYELYLQSRPLFHARVDLDVADELLARALEVDPAYAKAWGMRAALQKLKIEYSYSDSTMEVAETMGREFAERALELDAKNATALAAIAKIEGDAAEELRGTVSLAEIFADFDRALEADPYDASALNWRGLRYMHVGYLEAALRDFSRCVQKEPYYVPCVENNFTVLGAMGRDAESLAAYVEALNAGAVNFAYLPTLARLDMEVAFKAATNGSLLLSGWREHAELYSAYKDPESDHGELIESIRTFLDARETGYYGTNSFVTHPIGNEWRIPDSLVMWDQMMHAYRQTETFKTYLRESGVVDYWQQAGFPPQCRPLGSDDFECD